MTTTLHRSEERKDEPIRCGHILENKTMHTFVTRVANALIDFTFPGRYINDLANQPVTQ